MKAVLLAAGMGTRLKPLTDTLPKCLVPIQGKPLLDFWLELLTGNEQISDIYINLYYRWELVQQHLNVHWNMKNNIHCYHEENLLGTAGTLCALHDQLRGEPVVVIHADNLSDFCLQDFIRAHKNRPQDCLITMMLFETDTPGSCGIVELDHRNRVIKMHEKAHNPPGNLANAAVYIMEEEVLEWISKHKASDISAEVIPAFHGRIYSWLNTGYHRDIGTPESYAIAQNEFTKSVPKPA